MHLNVVQRVSDDVVLGDQIFEFPSIGVLLNALRNDTEAIQVNQLVLCVLKVIPVQVRNLKCNRRLTGGVAH